MSSDPPRSSANPDHLSSASPELSRQPPFPEPGTGGQRDPAPKHPYAERLINTAARHLAPEKPAPSGDEDEEDAQINKPDSEQREKREEEPLLRGTPLDELTTPGIGLPASPKVETINEEPSRNDYSDARQGASKRPGLNAMRGVGSDSVSALLLYPTELYLSLTCRFAWEHPPYSRLSIHCLWTKTRTEETPPKTMTSKGIPVKIVLPRPVHPHKDLRGRTVGHLRLERIELTSS